MTEKEREREKERRGRDGFHLNHYPGTFNGLDCTAPNQGDRNSIEVTDMGIRKRNKTLYHHHWKFKPGTPPSSHR